MGRRLLPLPKLGVLFGSCLLFLPAHSHSHSESESDSESIPIPGLLALLDAGESRKIQFASSRARSQQLNQQIALEIQIGGPSVYVSVSVVASWNLLR